MTRGQHQRLRHMLKVGCEIIQQTGPDYEDAISEMLIAHNATGFEVAWLSPRYSGYMHGIQWGYNQGQLDMAAMIAQGGDNLDHRRN